MRKAMDRMEAGTGMRFTEVENNAWNQLRWLTFSADFAKIGKKRLRGGGESTIGKRWQSYLTLDLDYVDHEPTVNHEMGHLFGLLHEHQRYDRHKYVRVGTRGSNYDKLSHKRKSCVLGIFWCKTVTNTTVYGTQYDYNSVMHYESCYRTVDRITLKNGKYWKVKRANNDRWGDENGNTYFTPWDIYTIKKLYGITPNFKPSYTPTPGTEYVLRNNKCE